MFAPDAPRVMGQFGDERHRRDIDHRYSRLTLYEAQLRFDRCVNRYAEIQRDPALRNSMTAVVAKLFVESWRAHVERLESAAGVESITSRAA